MKLTTGQLAAFEAVMRWIKDPDSNWCFKLSGFAGTGKTTLVKFIIDHLDVAPICCAPTGKAASVLESKLEGAMVTTVHSALYSPIGQNADLLQGLMESLLRDPHNEDLKERIETEKKELLKQRVSFSTKIEPDEYKGQMFLVDEASMVDKRMAYDFRLSGAKILFIGDSGQLPPVGDNGWFGESRPDYTLTEVMRQALDNPIIRLSMEIRETGTFNRNNYKNCDEVRIIPKAECSIGDWLSCDQVLTGSNVLRRRINRFFRKQNGATSKLPLEGEKLICLKNNFDSLGLINGVSAQCIQNAFYDEDGELRISVLFEDQVKAEIPLYSYPFDKHYDSTAEEDPWTMRRDLAEFDWAYAITVHKSQGSEFDKVILSDDGFWVDKPNHRRRWLYTAITRAKKELIWVS